MCSLRGLTGFALDFQKPLTGSEEKVTSKAQGQEENGGEQRKAYAPLFTEKEERRPKKRLVAGQNLIPVMCPS